MSELKRESRKFESREAWIDFRKDFVTSTEVAALFGLSSWGTPFKLWHEKRGDLTPEFKDTKRMQWGQRMEAVIAAIVSEEIQSEVVLKDDFGFLPEHKLGASYDYETEINGIKTIVEIKNVDSLIFRDKFISEGNVLLEASLDIEFQMQTQLLVSGYPQVLLAVFVGGNRLFLLRREPDEIVQAKILKKVRQFWDDPESPEPDFEKDLPSLQGLFEDGDAEFQATEEEMSKLEDLMCAYVELGEIAKNASGGKDAVKGELLYRTKGAMKVIGKKYQMNRYKIAATKYEVDRKESIGMRISKKRLKKSSS